MWPWRRGDRGKKGEEFRREIEQAMNGLAAVTEVHQATWKLGEASWEVDQDEGKICFTAPDGVRAEAPVQIIGTYSTLDGTWLWGWNHPSVLPPLAENARRMRRYGEERGYSRLTTRTFRCSEQEAWELTALAFRVCGANGAYRAPAGSAQAFLTFGELELKRTA